MAPTCSFAPSYELTSTLTPSHSQPPPFSLFFSRARLSLHLIFLRSFLLPNPNPNLRLPSICIPIPVSPILPSNFSPFVQSPNFTSFSASPIHQNDPPFRNSLLADTRQHCPSNLCPRFSTSATPAATDFAHARISPPRKRALPLQKYGPKKKGKGKTIRSRVALQETEKNQNHPFDEQESTRKRSTVDPSFVVFCRATVAATHGCSVASSSTAFIHCLNLFLRLHRIYLFFRISNLFIACPVFSHYLAAFLLCSPSLSTLYSALSLLNFFVLKPRLSISLAHCFCTSLSILTFPYVFGIFYSPPGLLLLLF